MSDDKTKEDGRDDSKIDVHDPSEVEYEAKKLGVTSAEIRDAIKEVGNSRAKVAAYFNGK